MLLLALVFNFAVFYASLSVSSSPVLNLEASGGVTPNFGTEVEFVASLTPDFSITAQSPLSFVSGSLATSQVVVTPLSEFHSKVALIASVDPSVGLSTYVSPSSLDYGSGVATATFTSSTPGRYTVTIAGTSGSLSHNCSLTVTVMPVRTADFTITASSSLMNVKPSTSGVTIVTINPSHGFTGTVTLSTSVSPTGPIATVSISNISGGSGTSTLTVTIDTNVPSGNYTVTVLATSGNLVHSTSINVTVSEVQEFTMTANVSSLNFNSGSTATAIITVSPQNGFTGMIALAFTATAGLSCNLSPTTVRSSGTSTLTCNSRAVGDYIIRIKATGGVSQHTTTLNVHVVAVSESAPAPSKILGLTPAIFYSLILGFAIVVLGALLALRSRRASAQLA
jgi:hypothetical protein